MPKSARDEPPPLPGSDRRWRGGDKGGGKQVEREAKRQTRRASGKVEPNAAAPGKERGHVATSKVTTKAFVGRGNDPAVTHRAAGGKSTLPQYTFHPLAFCVIKAACLDRGRGP